MSETKTVELPGGPASMTGEPTDGYFADLDKHAPEMFPLAALVAEHAPKGWLILDIGANIGMSAIALSRVAGDRQVKAFEPSPRNAAFLRQNIAANGIGNVEVIEAGVSHKRGQLGFQEAPFGAGSHIVGPSHLAPKWETIQVPLVALDDVITDTVAFMKIDVEGHEPNVLAGARRLLERCRPLIFMEFNVWCLNALGGHSPAAFAGALWQSFDVWRLRENKLVPMDLDAIGFIYKTIVAREDSDIVIRLKEGAQAPSLEEMTLPREIAAELQRLRGRPASLIRPAGVGV
jgi:FkbM family methyltransferase